MFGKSPIHRPGRRLALMLHRNFFLPLQPRLIEGWTPNGPPKLPSCLSQHISRTSNEIWETWSPSQHLRLCSSNNARTTVALWKGAISRKGCNNPYVGGVKVRSTYSRWWTQSLLLPIVDPGAMCSPVKWHTHPSFYGMKIKTWVIINIL